MKKIKVSYLIKIIFILVQVIEIETPEVQVQAGDFIGIHYLTNMDSMPSDGKLEPEVIIVTSLKFPSMTATSVWA